MSEPGTFDELNDQTFTSFVNLVYKLTGITLPASRKVMLQGRLRPRMRVLGIFDYKAYYDYLGSHPDETQLFIDQVTTNETYFYRTPRIWEFIENEFIPQWFAAKKSAVFTVWSAASSSGEEAYTLGMILQNFKEKHPNFQYNIIGTDINKDVREHAQKAQYSGRSIETLRTKRPELFEKYLNAGAGGVHTVSSVITSRVQFSRHNLFEVPKFNSPFDLVLIRNVLIYFGPEDQEKVLHNISKAMRSEATLIIGESESLHRLQTQYVYKQPLIYTLPEQNKGAA